MKICLVTDAWKPQINGIVTTLTTLVDQLRKEGHSVEIVHPGLFSNFPMPYYNEVEVPWNYFRARSVCKKAIDNADMVHIATEGPLGVIARLYCHKHDVKYITSYHNKLPEHVHARYPNISIERGYKVMRWMHKRAERVLVTTKTMMGELDSWGISNTVVWNRGVDIDKFRPKNGLRNDKETKLIGYVGRVNIDKNMEAFFALPDYLGEKIVIGDGPAKAEYEAKYPKVHFTGFRTGEDLVNAYNQLSVMVFPSLTDTFGLVNIESMACGTPVAAFPVTGPVDIIDNGVTGYMSEDLEEAVKQCLQIDRKQCRIQVCDRFSWDSVTRVFLEVAEDINGSTT